MKKSKKMVVFIVLLLLSAMTYNFYTGKILGKNTKPIFEGYQSDSEHLVFSEIVQEKLGTHNSYGLTRTMYKQRELEIVEIEGDLNKIKNDIAIVDYTSQFGLQGHIFSFAYNKLHIPFSTMQFVCSLLLAIVFISICYFIYKKYDYLMATIFYIAFLISPWIVDFARNLYWVEFTWFIPMLIGLVMSLNYKRDKKKILLYLGMYLAIFIKCLCGYEYISTIMLSAVAFFIVDFFLQKKNRKEIFKTTFIVGIVCLLGFASAVMIHASVRGSGSVIGGIKKIYKEDVLRRAFSTNDTDFYPEVYKKSLESTVLEVVDFYFNPNDDLFPGVTGNVFPTLVLSAFAIALYNKLKNKKHGNRDLILYVVLLSLPMSWYVLARPHSYIHVRLNFVLWYFGFIQFCLYLLVKFTSVKMLEIGKHVEKGDFNL